MSEFRKRIIDPMIPPVAAVGFIGLLVFSFSRILLAIPEKGSTTIALLVSAEILGVASVLAATTRLKSSQRVVLLLIGLSIIGGGAASAALGVRHIESEARVELVADKIKFTTDHLALPADTPVALVLDNRDAGIQHNVAISKGESEIVFNGDIFPGPAKRLYRFEPLEAGEYSFFCAVHPLQMKGTVTVGEEGGIPPPTGTVTPTTAPVGVPVTEADIVAKRIAFDVKTLTFRAETQITVHFDNQDAFEHNWALYTKQGGNPIFQGEIFIGPKEVDYAFPGAPAGTYYFQCDVHLNMSGTAVFK